jgi:hypothetical protein
MTNQTELYCKNGNHSWMRDAQRGKPPSNCPEHKPEQIKLSPTIMIHCDLGDHDYETKRRRGKYPQNCEDHMPTLSRSISETRPKDVLKRLEREPTKRDKDWLKEADRLVEDVTATKLVHCLGGDHSWYAPVKKGRMPLSCPEHSQDGKKIREGELAQEKKEKAQETLQGDLARKSARVEEATERDREAMSELKAGGGASKCSIETFNEWLKANGRLLNEVLSLRATEKKLEMI